MKMRSLPAAKACAAEQPILQEDWKVRVWPVVKRLPAYIRLAWALARDPAIPQRDKLLLYSVVLYSVSPLAFALGTIPIVGQVDNFALLLLAIRQTLRHCKPEITSRHCARFHLSTSQVSEDLHTLADVARRAVMTVGAPLKEQARFAGRVAAGFGKRTLRRLITPRTSRY